MVDLVCGSVDLISRRISSIDFEMKDDFVRSWRRMIEEVEEPAIETSLKKKKNDAANFLLFSFNFWLLFLIYFNYLISLKKCSVFLFLIQKLATLRPLSGHFALTRSKSKGVYELQKGVKWLKSGFF